MEPTRRESVERAKRIAISVLDGYHDLLLACVEINRLRADLPPLPSDVMELLSVVDSEVDGLPLGPVRA